MFRENFSKEKEKTKIIFFGIFLKVSRPPTIALVPRIWLGARQT
jgi:hypothetical protein